jgi:UDP-glucose 4-epimerase
VISIFADKLNQGAVPTIFGDGQQTRDFVYVSDVVEANMQAATKESAAGQVINIATGNKITLNELLNTFCEIKQLEFNAEYQDPRQGDIKESYANVSKAASVLDWNSTVELNQGLRALIEQ